MRVYLRKGRCDCYPPVAATPFCIGAIYSHLLNPSDNILWISPAKIVDDGAGLIGGAVPSAACG